MKLILSTLVVVMFLALTACGGGDPEDQPLPQTYCKVEGKLLPADYCK